MAIGKGLRFSKKCLARVFLIIFNCINRYSCSSVGPVFFTLLTLSKFTTTFANLSASSIRRATLDLCDFVGIIFATNSNDQACKINTFTKSKITKHPNEVAIIEIPHTQPLCSKIITLVPPQVLERRKH